MGILGEPLYVAGRVSELKARIRSTILSSGSILCLLVKNVDVTELFEKLTFIGHVVLEGSTLVKSVSTERLISEVNEVAWRFPLVIHPHGRKIFSLSVSDFNSISILHYIKNGFTILGLKEEGVSHSEFENAVVELDSISTLISRPLGTFGIYSRDVVDIVENVSVSTMYRNFGNYLRYRLLKHAFDTGREIYMLGSEVESVDMIYRQFRLKGRNSIVGHFGINERPKRLVDMETEYDDEIIPENEADGQKKLFAVDFPFFGISHIVVAIGGSPGDHFGDDPNIISVDPRPMSNGFKGIYIPSEFNNAAFSQISSLVGDRTYSVLMDIRPDRDGMSDHDWEMTIHQNNLSMFSWYRNHFLPDNRCVGVSIKFRPPRFSVLGMYSTYRIPKCDIILQPYVWSLSNETRLFMDLRFERSHDTISIDNDGYYLRLKRWNILRFNDPSLNDQQSKNISTYFVQQGDYLKLDLSFFSDSIMIALFTMSNQSNNKNDVFDFISRCNKKSIELHSVFPNDFSQFDIEYATVNVSEGTLKQDNFVDNTYDAFDFHDLGYVFPCSEVEILKMCFENIFPFEGNNPLMKIWFYFTNVCPIDCNFQTVENSQTHFAKPITAIFRIVFEHDDSTLISFRTSVLEKDELYVRSIDDRRVNGVIVNSHGKEMVVSVAGHMIGLLMAYHYGYLIDWRRYIRTIEYNVKFYAGKETRSERLLMKRYRKEGRLMEDLGTNVLWHSYHDWRLALDAFIAIAKELFITINDDLLFWIRNKLDDVLKRYPSFEDEGWQSAEFKE
jgi:hypothetical protein